MNIIVDLFNQHSGDIDELKRMALSAHLSGADMVKLQLLNSKRIWGDDSRKYLELNFEQTKDFYDYCKNLGIKVFSTVFDEERLEWIDELGADIYKIASITVREDKPLCEKILSRNKPTLISLGFCELEHFPFGQDENISYLYCIPEYPTLLSNAKIDHLPKKFSKDRYVGYSDHCIGISVALRSVYNHAQIVEKHFTLKENCQSDTEKAHLCSFTPSSLRTFADLCKEINTQNSYSRY